jgi:aminoglycoside phosphotransferase (APT) family kinase protein
MARELVLLPELAGALSSVGIGTPIVTFRGNPTDEYPYPWAVLEWIPGDDAWTANRSNNRLTGSDPRLASDLAAAVLAIGATVGVSAPERKAGDRGGPLRRLLARLDWWLDEPRWGAEQLIDVPAVRRLAAESLEVADVEVSQRFVHGDLIPGNIIVADGRLSALIDWGSAAYADPAQDLSPAWSILDRDARNVFRHAVGADDASWLRARAFELEHAVGGILYYTPRKHPLADVMARTLHRILTNE